MLASLIMNKVLCIPNQSQKITQWYRVRLRASNKCRGTHLLPALSPAGCAANQRVRFAAQPLSHSRQPPAQTRCATLIPTLPFINKSAAENSRSTNSITSKQLLLSFSLPLFLSPPLLPPPLFANHEVAVPIPQQVCAYAVRETQKSVDLLLFYLGPFLLHQLVCLEDPPEPKHCSSP